MERIDPTATRTAARSAIAAIFASGRTVSAPRSWLKDARVKVGHGTVAVVSHERPDIALVLKLDTRTIVTCIPKRGWHPDDPNDPGRLGLTGPTGSPTKPGANGRRNSQSTTNWQS